MTPVLHRSATCWLVTPLLVLGASLAGAADATFAPKAAVDSVKGAEIYNQICQGCHMPQGLGAVGAGHYPKLAGDAALSSWQYVAMTVLGGRNGMPPFGVPADGQMEVFAAYLSDQQIADVVNYVRGHFGNKYKEKVTASQIAALPHPGAVAAR
jgi:mono/diheme cytochrome c family protein